MSGMGKWSVGLLGRDVEERPPREYAKFELEMQSTALVGLDSGHWLANHANAEEDEETATLRGLS